ncbi:MAG: hypothetical protein R3361_08270 [Aequorivita vladivostokensis]|nr:hypothetical protein [Aequorivita vladivostokensis]
MRYVSPFTKIAASTTKQEGKQMENFNINQIVNGKAAGTFIILGFRNIGGEIYAQLKEVNPNNHSQTAPGEIALPISAIVAA